MCGIIGYTGPRAADDILLAGLKRLEYRGYDSAGIATLHSDCLNVVKCEGSLADLESSLQAAETPGSTGIGHTRWATHGEPSDCNSHPHQDCGGRFAVVHNGIIENYKELKDDLKQDGHEFTSETDTEVLVHLLEEIYAGDMPAALRRIDSRLEGSYALAVLDRENPEQIHALRQDSPLVVGLGQEENFLASDMPALLEHTDEFYVLEDGDLAVISSSDVKLHAAAGEEDGDREKALEPDLSSRYFQADWDAEMVDKKGYDHYMLKEIHEQPTVARRFLGDRLKGDEISLDEVEKIWKENEEIDRIMITACGTAYYSGCVGRHVIEELAGIPVDVELGSELRYKQNFIDENTLVVVVSQSGETADTLAALEMASEKGASVLALTNTVSSSIARQADQVIAIKAGPEIAVASTKAYLAMLLGFYLLALKLADLRGTLPEPELDEYRREVLKLPDRIEATLNRTGDICRELAPELAEYESVFFIGRNLDYSLALEGALKLKEISYIHAESYPAGELKHGTLALVEEGVPVLALMTRRSLARKTLSNVEEVRARGGRLIVLASEEIAGRHPGLEESFRLIELPLAGELWAGVQMVIPLQLIAYYTARDLERSIDKPRNLAKSVTVE